MGRLGLLRQCRRLVLDVLLIRLAEPIELMSPT